MPELAPLGSSFFWLGIISIWTIIPGAITRCAFASDAVPNKPTLAVGRVLPPGELPADRRLTDLPRNLDGYFPCEVPANWETWARRAEKVRRRVQFATGQWPAPPRDPPAAIVHGRVERDEYTVEKVILQSLPGHFVTGNLYRPRTNRETQRHPAVLCPHGHWQNGRFHDWGPDEVARQIASRAEYFPQGGRYPLQARCVHLARMGCVVFMYDMVGYADSQQIPIGVIHGWDAHRPEMEGPTDWGFYSPQAEMRMITPIALQTRNSLAALDFLSTLPDVDPARIGVTGASGGGTQTFVLGAIDPRPAVIMPAVMVSTAMQGGCPCENGCGLRVGTGNVEIAALFAPKPLGLTSANDWTKEMETKGFPELQAIYRLAGVPDHVALTALTQFDHNYNHPSRAAMYAWMHRHLGLPGEECPPERDFQPLTREEMSVWDAAHPAPTGGVTHERELVAAMARMSDISMSLDADLAGTAGGFPATEIHGAIEILVDRELPDADELVERARQDQCIEGTCHIARVVRLQPGEEEIPQVLMIPPDWTGDVVLWIFAAGKLGLETSRSCVDELLAHGVAVASADLLGQGEFLHPGETFEPKRVPGNRDIAAFTYGYNRTVAAERAGDILTCLSALESLEPRAKRLHLAGSKGTAVYVGLAAAVARSRLAGLALDTGGFRFTMLRDWHDPDFLPGGLKYGDLPGILGASAPLPMLLHGETAEQCPLLCRAYRAHACAQAIEFGVPPSTTDPIAAEDPWPLAAAKWIVDRTRQGNSERK